MIQRIRKVQFTGDPLTLPARSNEIEFLVRLFYKLSCRLNETVIPHTILVFTTFMYHLPHANFKYSNFHYILSFHYFNFQNFQYAVEIEQLYRRSDLVGRIARRVLESPRIIQTFEKSHGSSELVERRLRPRVNLRGLASYRTVFIICLSFLVGKLLFGGSFFGFFMLILFKVTMTLLLATYEFVFKS